MNNEQTIIALKGFSDEMQKEAAAGLFSKAKTTARAFTSGIKGDPLKATKGASSGVISSIHRNREKAHALGKHFGDNKLTYGVGAAGLGTGYLIGK